MFLIDPIRNWYARFERPISSLSLIAGFVFDALTLKRVDTLWENSWIFGHIVIVGFFIALIHAREIKPGDEKNPEKLHFWYVNILQFFFGGLLSTYLVFYFRSADIFSTWPFILLLGLAFIANESLKRHYVRFSFQISLLFLSIYSFAIFLIPVLLHKIGPVVFLLSGVVSLASIITFVYFLFRFTEDRLKKSKNMISFLIISIFCMVNFLYFTNLIPPIPLSLKDAGVYHSVQKTNDGNYLVTYEDHGWREYFKLYKDFYEVPGTYVYAYNAIFSPRGLNLNIIHEWQHYDELTDRWATLSVINLPVIGGRDSGFRTFSRRNNLAPGLWRVNIETEQGQIIGHLHFNIIETDIESAVVSEVKK